jgi:8-hydroxy-5-deazaflavin:NADPH oxidoreductase
MNIGIIGTGNMGSGLGRLWANAGHSVCFGSRDPQKARDLATTVGGGARGGSIAEAAAHAQAILLAVRWQHIESAVAAAGPLDGKILIDCTNPLTPDWLTLLVGHTTSSAERIAELAEGALVVKAFNHIYAQIIHSSPRFGGQNASVFYCGDDPAAKEVVAGLIEDIGFDPVDAGALPNARLLEPVAELMVQLAYVIGTGTDQALKLIRR